MIVSEMSVTARALQWISEMGLQTKLRLTAAHL